MIIIPFFQLIAKKGRRKQKLKPKSENFSLPDSSDFDDLIAWATHYDLLHSHLEKEQDEKISGDKPLFAPGQRTRQAKKGKN